MLEILLIEPNLDSGVAICSFLRARGYRVIFTTTVSQGLDLLQNYIPDVVIANSRIPEINGHTILQVLRQNPLTAKTPIFLLANSEDENDQLSDANEYFIQPIDLRILLQALIRHSHLASAKSVTKCSQLPEVEFTQPPNWRLQAPPKATEPPLKNSRMINALGFLNSYIRDVSI